MMHRSEIILGPAYFQAQRLLKKSSRFSAAELQHLQRQALARVLAAAARDIPYYRERNLADGIRPDNAIECLGRFPVMSKPIIRREADRLVRHQGLRALKATTGGSSASPMPFFLDRIVTRQAERAFMWDQWARIGYRPGDTLASFSGNLPAEGRICSYDWLFNKYVFNPFDSSPAGVAGIVGALNRIRPDFLHGYPSILTELARGVMRGRAELNFRPQGILCGSEKMFPHQRTLLQEVFGACVYSWYGHSEYCVLGGECEVSTAYHLYPQYGYVEFFPVKAAHESDKPLFEIVATGFNNSMMPFIRYRTGDFAILADEPCTCGRHYPLVQEVVGRMQEFLVDSQDNLVSLSALTSLFEKMPFIDELAFAQDRPGEFIFSIMSGREPSPAELQVLQDRIEQATRGRLRPVVELVSTIERAPSGKHRLVDQQIDIASHLERQ